MVGTIDEVFGLVPLQADVERACNLGLKPGGGLKFDPVQRTYRLTHMEREAVESQINDGDRQERQVMATWFAQVDDLLPDVAIESAWKCLVDYLSGAFLRFGVEALPVLLGEIEFDNELDLNETPVEMLRASIQRNGLDPSLASRMTQAVAVFFDGADPLRVQYLSGLSNSTFAFMTLALDDETRESLREGIPKLSIFLDTNVIHGMIGAHSQPLATASSDLLRVIREARLPFELYYHEKTLGELERTVEAAFHRVRSVRWSQHLSRAIVRTPATVSSLELRYHEQNAVTATDPAIFFGKFENMPLLLKDYGLKVFREANDKRSSEKVALLVAEYDEYAKMRAKGKRKRSYEQLDHDMRVWQVTNNRQVPSAKSQMASGALFLSADSLLRSFDRDILSKLHGHGVALVLRPDTFLQSLRPFVTTVDDYEAAFCRTFSSPEFRGAGGFNEVAGRVAAYLATYADFPEETAVRLLTNAVLMSRLRRLDEEDEEWAKLISDAIVDENERLLDEREEFVKASRLAVGMKKRAMLVSGQLESIIGSADIDPEAIASIRQALEIVQDTQKQITLIERVTIDMSRTGDKFVNNDSQVAAQGHRAHAEDTTQTMDNRKLDVGLGTLEPELARLRERLAQTAGTSEEFHVIGEIVGAIEATNADDPHGVKERLRKAGAYALDVAKELGLKVAESAIKQSMGLP